MLCLYFYLLDIIEQYYDKKLDEGQCVLLERNTRPPRLLICYSNNDGPAHVKVVLQLAAFLQKHMATQVSHIMSTLNKTTHSYFLIIIDIHFYSARDYLDRYFT